MYGNAEGIVVGTGMDTEVGEIAKMFDNLLPRHIQSKALFLRLPQSIRRIYPAEAAMSIWLR